MMSVRAFIANPPPPLTQWKVLCSVCVCVCVPYLIFFFFFNQKKLTSKIPLFMKLVRRSGMDVLPQMCQSLVPVVHTLVEHSLSFPKGCFPTIRHNEVRDTVAGWMSEVCNDVCVEPPFSMDVAWESKTICHVHAKNSFLARFSWG